MNGPAQIPHRRWPCDPCPWRTDTTGCRFTYSNLAEYTEGTVGSPGAEAPLGAPMFACHHSKTTPAELCAGWLAVAGYRHLTVRFAIVTGHLDEGVLEPQPGWPELFGSYEEMAAAQAGDNGRG